MIEIVYIRLASPQLALSRIANRVRQGGHDVPRPDVIRRFKRGWANFLNVNQPLGCAALEGGLAALKYSGATWVRSRADSR